jgi:hypothetical protein
MAADVEHGKGACPVGESVGDAAWTTRTPFGINLAAGAAAMVVATAVTSAASAEASARLAVTAVAVAGYAAGVADARAGVAVAGMAYLLFDGFLVNRHGELTWGGATSVRHLAIFASAVGLGLLPRLIHYVMVRAALIAELEDMAEITISNDKESRSA